MEVHRNKQTIVDTNNVQKGANAEIICFAWWRFWNMPDIQ